MDTNALGRALGSVGQNLGTVANYTAEQERFAAQQKILDRREQAQNAFREHLELLSQQNSNSQRDIDRQQHTDEFGQTMDMHNKELAISQQRADTQDQRTQQQLDIENKRLGLEGAQVDIARDREENQKTANTDMKTASTIGQQMKNIGGTITQTRRQMQTEIGNATKDISFQTKSAPEQAAVLDAIKAKYKPIIDTAQQKYDQYSSKWEKLTGVADAGADYTGAQPSASDDLGGATATPDTSTTSGEAAPVGGAGQASPVAQGGTTQPPSASAPPRPGAKQAPDGNWYIPDPNRPGKYLLVNQ